MATRATAARDTKEAIRYSRKDEHGLVKKKDHFTGEIIYTSLLDGEDDVTPLVQKLKALGVTDSEIEDGDLDDNMDYNSISGDVGDEDLDDNMDYNSISGDVGDEDISSYKRKELSPREKALSKVISKVVAHPKVKAQLPAEWFIQKKWVDAISKLITRDYMFDLDEIQEGIKKLF